MSQNKVVIDAVKYWLEEVVIGQNFCPFAKKPFLQDKIQYEVTPKHTPNELFEQVTATFKRLDENQDIETVLLIINDLEFDFDDYLDYLDFAQTITEQTGYAGIYQIASFHPQYTFAGESPDDASQFTNRAPYPILHILREDSLSKVLEQYPNPEEIPEQNIERAQSLGVDYFADVLKQAFHRDA